MLRSGARVARNVRLLVSGLLLLDQHVTILGHCRAKQPWLARHWTQQLLDIWARHRGTDLRALSGAFSTWKAKKKKFLLTSSLLASPSWTFLALMNVK